MPPIPTFIRPNKINTTMANPASVFPHRRETDPAKNITKSRKRSNVCAPSRKKGSSIVAGMPNMGLRSALFACFRRKGVLWIDAVNGDVPTVKTPILRRDFDEQGILKRVGVVDPQSYVEQPMLLDSVAGYEIWFHGERLNQDDSLLWWLALEEGTKVPPGALFEVSVNEWLRRLRRVDNGANHGVVIESLLRLAGANIWVRRMVNGKLAYEAKGAMLSIMRNAQNGRVALSLTPTLLPMFKADLTEIDVERKAGLTLSIASWLHDFLSSHTDPYPYSVDLLQRLCSVNDRLANFRLKLRKAVAELESCDPPLLQPGSFIDEHDRLVVKKATNSRIVPLSNVDDQAAQPMRSAYHPLTAEEKARAQRARVAL